MALSANVSSQMIRELERLLNLMGSGDNKKYCKGLAQDYGLTEEDIEDFHANASKKLWLTYFSPTSVCRYQRQSDPQDESLLRKILHDAAVDYSKSNGKHKAESLDAPLVEEDDFSLADLVSKSEDFDTRLIILETIEEVCRKSRSEGPRLVARFLLEEIDRDELLEYDDNYIRVYKHRFQKAVRHALRAD